MKARTLTPNISRVIGLFGVMRAYIVPVNLWRCALCVPDDSNWTDVSECTLHRSVESGTHPTFTPLSLNPTVPSERSGTGNSLGIKKWG